MLHRALIQSRAAESDFTLTDDGGTSIDGIFEFKSDNTVSTINFDKPITVQGTPLDPDGLTGDISQLQSDLTDVSGRVAANETNITTNASNITTNSSNITTNSNNITDVSGRVAANETNISSLQTQQTTNTSNISTLQGTVANHTSLIGTNTSNISTNTSNISTNFGLIQTNEQAIDTNSTNINANTSSITTLDTSVNRLENISTINASTGIYTGGLLSVNSGDNTKFDLTAGTGLISDGTTTYVSWNAFTAQTLTGTNPLTTRAFTHIYIDDQGAIYQSIIEPTAILRRNYIYIGKVVHNTTAGTILVAFSQPEMATRTANNFSDFIGGIANVVVLKGCEIGSYTGLQMSITQGKLYGSGINYATDAETPNIKAISATNGFSFAYRLLDNTEGTSRNTIDSNNYESSPGTLTALSNNKWTNQYIYIFPSGLIRAQYGQYQYNSSDEAIADIANHTLETNILDNAVLLSVITIQKGATDFTSATFTQADFIGQIGKGVASSGGASTTSLQQAYDNGSVITLTNGTNLIVENASNTDLLTVDNTNSKVVALELDVGAITNVETYITDLSGRVDTNTSNIATNTGNISTNTSNIATNTSNISTNTSNISTNTSNISTNTSSIATNTSNISTNQTNISTNQTNISTNTSNISTNTSNISTNQTNISTNTSNISTNTSNISTNTSNIATNTSNISTNATDITGKVSKSGDVMTGSLEIEDSLKIKDNTVCVLSFTNDAETTTFGSIEANSTAFKIGKGINMMNFYDGDNIHFTIYDAPTYSQLTFNSNSDAFDSHINNIELRKATSSSNTTLGNLNISPAEITFDRATGQSYQGTLRWKNAGVQNWVLGSSGGTSDNLMIYGSGLNNSFQIYTNGNNKRFEITNAYTYISNNLGLGTTNPQAKLDVSGSVVLKDTLTIDSTTTYSYIQFKSNGSQNWECGTHNTDDYWYVYKDGASSGYKLIVNSNGYVGINTTSPETMLHIYNPAIDSYCVFSSGRLATRTMKYYDNNTECKIFSTVNNDINWMNAWATRTNRDYTQAYGSLVRYSYGTPENTWRATGRGYRAFANRLPITRGNNEIINIQCKITQALVNPSENPNRRHYIGVLCIDEDGSDRGLIYLTNFYLDQGTTRTVNCSYMCENLPADTAYVNFLWLYNYSTDQAKDYLNIADLYDLRMEVKPSNIVARSIYLDSGANGNIDTTSNFIPLYIWNTALLPTAITNGYRVYPSSAQYSDDEFWAFNPSANTEATAIYSNTGTVIAPQFLVFSDKRIKRDIRDLSDGEMLDKLRALQPKAYKYKDFRKGNQETYGFIAQEYKEAIGAFACKTDNVEYVCDYNQNVKFERVNDTEIIEILDESGNPVNTTNTFNSVNIYIKQGYDLSVNDYIQLFKLDASYNDLGIEKCQVKSIDGNKVELDLEINDDVKYLYVYGKRYNDIHTIKKDLMFPIIVGAVQELDRKVQSLENKHDTNLVVENQADLVSIIEQQGKMINQMKEQMKVLQQRINYLELNI